MISSSSSSSSSNHSSFEYIVYPLYDSLCAYYPQIVLISLLGVITIFRREMSCNSVYVDGRRVVGKQRGQEEKEEDILLMTRPLLCGDDDKDEDGCSSSGSGSGSGGHCTNHPNNGNGSTSSNWRKNQNNHNNDHNDHNNNNRTGGGRGPSITTTTYYSNPLLFLRQVELLPQDVLMKCFTYLGPKDIITMSCVNRYFYNLLQCDKNRSSASFSSVLWFQLFLRDYAWVLTSWKYGKEAVDRSRVQDDDDNNITLWRCPIPVATLFKEQTCSSSSTSRRMKKQQNDNDDNDDDNDDNDDDDDDDDDCTLLPTMKEFYFTFAQTWLEYCIAGRTENPTLVGLHGHVFDMTSFLDQHPGSSETIIMQGAGKDSTAFFEAVGHSKNARSLAIEKLVQVIDLSCCCRVVRVRGFEQQQQQPQPQPQPQQPPQQEEKKRVGTGLVQSVQGDGIEILPSKRSNKTIVGPETLMTLRQSLDRDRLKHEKMAQSTISTIMARKGGERDIVGPVNVYFDPLCFCWKAWYLNLNFEPVFVHNLSSGG